MTETIERRAVRYQITLADVRELAESAGDLRVSIVLPLEVAFPQIKQNALRLRQATEAATKRLAALGCEGETLRAWTRLLESVDTDIRDLEHPTQALAVYLDERALRVFGLPFTAPESVAVGRSFRLRPLLRALPLERRYHVLAFSINRVRFFVGDGRGLEEVTFEGLPKNLEDALGSEVEGESLQYHSGAAGGGNAIYHGQGGAKDERQLDYERFYQALAGVLVPRFSDSTVPLVLFADDPHQGPLRRELAHVPALLPEGVDASPEKLSEHEIREAVRPVIERTAARRLEEARRSFEQAYKVGKAVEGLEQAIPAAVAGRVRRLWIRADQEVPGRVDENALRVVEARGDEDVLDELASLVLRRAGAVYAVDADAMPNRDEVAAELY